MGLLRTSLFLVVLIISPRLFAQEMSRDEKLRALETEKNDSIRIKYLRDIALSYETEDTASAFKYYHLAAALSKKTGDCDSESASYSDIGVVYMNSSRNDIADLYYRQSYEIASKCQNHQRMARSLGNLAMSFDNRNSIDSAVFYILGALREFEILNDSVRVCACYNKLSYYTGKVKLYEQAIEYAGKAVALGRTTNDDLCAGTALINTARLYRNTKQNVLCELYCDSSMLYVSKYPSAMNRARAYQNLATILYDIGVYPKAGMYTDSCLFYAEKLGAPKVALASYELKAELLLHNGDTVNAEKYLDTALSMALEEKDWRQLHGIYTTKSKLEYGRKNYKAAYEFRELIQIYADSMFDEEVAAKMADFNIQYQVEKRESELLKVTREKEIASMFTYLFVGISILAIVAAILLYINFKRRAQINRQNEAIQNQKIKDLEKEKQLIALDAIIKGEEKERSRVAKDLHDGLGSLLSGIKLSLSSMKGNVVISEAYARIFSSSLEQLDNAINEMRRVAHNMMPESLIKFGLIQAIQNFCDSLNETGNIRVHMEHHHFTERLASDQEITLYRIIQELVNNALKHANAKSIIIQLSRHENVVNLVVEDDGKGFDVDSLKTNAGAGYSNLQHRINYLKGKLDVKSDKHSGTSVLVEFPVSPAF